MRFATFGRSRAWPLRKAILWPVQFLLRGILSDVCDSRHHGSLPGQVYCFGSRDDPVGWF